MYKLIFLIGLFSISCNSTKKIPTDKIDLVIELRKGVDKSYLNEEYASFNLMDIKRNNKTLNQYSAKMELSEIKFQEFVEKANSDKNIFKIERLGNDLAPPSNSTNSGRSKTTPIRK